MYFPLFVGVLCLSLFCYALFCVNFSFAIIMKRKRKLVALLLLSCRCIVTINVLWLFLTVPWIGLQYVIVVFPDHTHLLFGTIQSYMPPGPLKIKEKSYSTDAPPSNMPTNTVKLYQVKLLPRCECNIHACWSNALCVESCYVAAAATNMPAGLV